MPENDAAGRRALEKTRAFRWCNDNNLDCAFHAIYGEKQKDKGEAEFWRCVASLDRFIREELAKDAQWTTERPTVPGT